MLGALFAAPTLHAVTIRKPFVRPSGTAFYIHDCFHSDDCFDFFVVVLFLRRAVAYQIMRGGFWPLDNVAFLWKRRAAHKINLTCEFTYSLFDNTFFKRGCVFESLFVWPSSRYSFVQTLNNALLERVYTDGSQGPVIYYKTSATNFSVQLKNCGFYSPTIFFWNVMATVLLLNCSALVNIFVLINNSRQYINSLLSTSTSRFTCIVYISTIIFISTNIIITSHVSSFLNYPSWFAFAWVFSRARFDKT